MPTPSRTGRPTEAVLPSEPKWVEIEASDGDSSRWPLNTIPIPDAEGYVNFMEPIPVDDGRAVKWRIVIGQALAEMLGYPDTKSRNWVLKDWPEAYAFYDHNKGKLGSARHDLYLVGSRNVARFRSPQEFIPHAYWLMTHNEQDRSKCECKYCAKKPQREISEAMNLSQRHAASSQAQFMKLPRREKVRRALPAREGRVFAAVRRAPKPVKLPKGPKQFVNPEREKDLRALLEKTTLGERRWAREGECVWVKLDHPIPVNERFDSSDEITFWPGIIDEVNVKAEITSRPQSEMTQNGQASASSSRNSQVEDDVPWTVAHIFMYEIKLLVTMRTIICGGDHILPYQSYAPDSRLLNEVQAVVFDLEDDVDDELGGIILPYDERRGAEAEQALFQRFQAFDPFPSSRPSITNVNERRQYCETAAGAFAAAIQIASCLSMYYTPCDAWEYKVQVPVNPLEVWGTTANDLTPAGRQSLIQSALGSQAASTQMITSQLRFQGLWWGAERIWMGDTVRLKLARHQLAPDGTEVIKKPSGPGKRESLTNGNHSLGSAQATTNGNPSTGQVVGALPNGSAAAAIEDVEMVMEDTVDSRLLGAASRSLFLRLDGLFVTQVATEDGQGQTNECRMCGTLYELADEDWELDGEEFAPRPPQSTVPATPSAERRLHQNHNFDTNGDNGSESSSAPLLSSSLSDLFTPNPDLLSQSTQSDVVMEDGTQANRSVVQEPPASLMPPQRPQHPLPDGPTPLQNEPSSIPHESSAKSESTTSINPSLSGPLRSSEYPTPPAPPSLKFRSILKDGFESIMPLTTLAGRYYPGILSNRLLQSHVREALETPETPDSRAILALEGLAPGVYNSVDSSHFLPRRGQMLREAESVAWRDVVEYWRRRASQVKNAIVIDDN